MDYILRMRDMAAEQVMRNPNLTVLFEKAQDPNAWRDKYKPVKMKQPDGSWKYEWMDEILCAGFGHLLQLNVGTTPGRRRWWRWWP